MPAATTTISGKLIGNFKFEAGARDHVVIVDQPKAGGGEDDGPNPLEYLLFSLGGCIATVSRFVSRRRRVRIRGLEVKIEGDINTDYLLGKTDEGRAGFREIRVMVKLDADLSDEEKREFLEEVDRRCPISDNLSHMTPVKFTIS